MSEDEKRINTRNRACYLFPTTLQRAAEGATKVAFRRFGIAHARLSSDWEHIVGPVLAAKALPQRIDFPKGKRDGGTLFLAVATGWALEMQHLEPVILEKIATYFGYRAVARIHITQRPLPVTTKSPPSKPKQSPLPETTRQRLEEATAQVDNPELKAALEKLGEGIFRKNR